tara:strand:- start:198 stop:662 length:465 start_codon:yes stop_codon:yes gene_type:complete
MIKINVISNNLKWKKYLSEPDLYIEKKIKKINKKENNYKKKIIYCTLLLSGDKEIRKLNKKFRKKNKATDVLSFPFYKKKELYKRLRKDKEIYLGDIIINLNKIKQKKNTVYFKSEFNKLWVHGLVHLFGYDHKKDKEFYQMAKIEKKLLNYLN